MRSRWVKSLVLASVFATGAAWGAAAENTQLTYSGRLFDNGGDPYASQSLDVRLEIKDSGSCYLYRKTTSVITDADGNFSVTLNNPGANTASNFIASSSVQAILSSTSSTPFSCRDSSGASVGSFTPSSNRQRQVDVLISLDSWVTSETVDSQVLEPYFQAVDSEKLGGFSAADYLKIGSSTSPKEILAYDAGAKEVVPLVCPTNGNVLTWDSGAGEWVCSTVASGGVYTNTGSGLTGGGDLSADRSLAVNVDGSTIEINSNTLRIKDSGVTDAKISAVSVGKIVSATGQYLSYMPNGTECSNGEVLVWNSASDIWECGSATFTLAANAVDSSHIKDGEIVDADVAAAAAIAWTKISKTGATAADVNAVAPSRNISAGAGLTGGGDLSADRSLAVNVDGSTIEINSNTLRIKDSGVGNAKIVGMSVSKLISGLGEYFKYTPNGTECSNGEVLVWNSASDIWECGTATFTLAANAVDSSHIKDGEIVDADVAAAAAIAWTKISKAGATAADVNAVAPGRNINTNTGSGLTGGGDLSADRNLAVNVDSSSIEINGNTLRIKDSGVTDVKISDVSVGKITNASGAYFSYKPNNTNCVDGEVLKWNDTSERWDCAVDLTGAGVTAHSALTGLTADDHTQYALLAGRAGGQNLRGGINAGDSLTLESTSNATKGHLLLQPSGGSVGIGTSTPSTTLSVVGDVGGPAGISIRNTSTASTGMTILKFENSGSDYGAFYLNGVNATAGGGPNSMNILSTGTMSIQAGSGLGLTLIPGGSLGIGADPSNAGDLDAKLTVRGGIGVGDSHNGSMHIYAKDVSSSRTQVEFMGIRPIVSWDFKSSSPDTTSLRVRRDSANGNTLSLFDQSGGANPDSDTPNILLNSNGTSYLGGGQVAIGMTSGTPSGLLHVQGKIAATEICDESGANCKDISMGWTGGGGSVTSVDMTAAAPLSVTGGPITGSGNFTLGFGTQSALTVLAGPTSGGAAAPNFRALTSDDLPAIDAAKIGSGLLPLSRGGTGKDFSAVAIGEIPMGTAAGVLGLVSPTSSNGVTLDLSAGNFGISTNATTTATNNRIAMRDGSGVLRASAFEGNGAYVSNLRLKDSSTGEIQFRAPVSVTDYTLTWPSAAGSANQFLRTDASGNLSWASVTTASDVWINGGNSFGATGVLGTNDNYGLSLETNNITRLTVTSVGSVGIGTAAPAGRLHILEASGDADLILESTAANANATLSLFSRGGSTTRNSMILSDNSGNLAMKSDSGSYIISSNTGADRMVIAATGASAIRVGIGTTTPQAILDVQGGTPSDSAIILPRDSTLNRPTGIAGMIRYNTSLSKFEVFDTGWSTLQTGHPDASGGAGQLQFYSSGTLGASADLSWDNTNKSLLLDGGVGSQIQIRPTGSNQYAEIKFLDEVGATQGFVGYKDADQSTFLDSQANSVHLSVGGAPKLKVSNLNPVEILRRDATTSGALSIYSNNNSNSVTIQSPTGMSSNLTLTLPSTNGASGNVLATDGSGVLSWASVGTGDFKKDGSVAMTGAFRAADGTAAAPSISFASESNSGFFYTGTSDTIGIVAGGVQQFSFDTSGLYSVTNSGPLLRSGTNSLSNPAYSFKGDTSTGLYRVSAGVVGISATGTLAMSITANEVTMPGQVNIPGGTFSIGIGGATVFQTIGALSSDNSLSIGYNSSTKLGVRNTVVGAYAKSNQTASAGYDNVLVGNSAALTNGVLVQSVAVGSYAGYYMTSATDNVLVGYLSGPNLTAGTSNIFIGTRSGANISTGTNNIFIGTNEGVGTNGSYSNQLSVGGLLKGSLGVSKHLTISGSLGVGIAGVPSEMVDVGGNVRATAFISTSDERLKMDIRPAPGLSAIRQLNGKQYRWRSNGDGDAGVIAQELEQVFPEAVRTDANGFKAVKYNYLLAPLIEAVKELDVRCEQTRADLERRVEDLESRNRTLEDKNRQLEERLLRLERAAGLAE